MESVQLGSVTLQPRRQLMVEGRRVQIGKRALDIISVLAEAGGEIVTKDELFDAVWPGLTVEENALQVHIVALRKALGPEAGRLNTIRGVGYQLHCEPGRFPQGEMTGPIVASIVQEPLGGSSSTPSILVLPFENMSADPDQEYFADGMTEDIITDLAQVSALRVIPRSSAFALKGKRLELAETAVQYNVTHILQGSVRRSDKRLRVSVQLVDGQTSNHVWTQRYDHDLADIFDLQDELTFAIVDALKVSLLPSEADGIGVRGTTNPEAYDLYVRARALRATMQLENVIRAPEFYRQAIKLDPGFAIAWAGLASSLHQNLTYLSDTTIRVEEIDEALAQALKLAPDDLAVIASRAQRCMSSLDWLGADECISVFRKRKDYNWSICSHLLLLLGRAGEAADHQLEVWRSDPLSPGAIWGLQVHLDCAGRLDEADFEYLKSCDLLGKRRALDWEGVKRMMARHDHAQVCERYLDSTDDDPQELPNRDRLKQAVHDRDEAILVVREEAAGFKSSRNLDLERIAHWAAYLGDADLALEAVRRCASHGYGLITIWHPNFAQVRHSPGFKEFLRELGLVDYWRTSGNWGEFCQAKGVDDFEVIN